MRRSVALLLLLSACAHAPVEDADIPASSASAPRLASARPLDVKRNVEGRGRYGVSFALPAGASISMRYLASSAVVVKLLRHPRSDVSERGEALDVLCPGHRASECQLLHSDGGTSGNADYATPAGVPEYVSFVWENPSADPVALEMHFDVPRGARIFSDIPRDE